MKDSLQSLLSTVDSGGAVIIALAILSLVLYRSSFGTYLFIKKTIRGTSSNTDRNSHLRDDSELFQEEFDAIVKRQVTFIGVLATAAPLLGLLGTVEGMLETFDSLAQRAGTDTSRQVSAGVSKALITTQAGLLVAIPALFMIQLIKREANKVNHIVSGILLKEQNTGSHGMENSTNSI